MTKTSRHSLSSKTFDASHIKIYEKRAKQVRLKWCSQVASIMKKKNPSENVKINDLGCNYFQLYKELKLQKLTAYGIGEIESEILKLSDLIVEYNKIISSKKSLYNLIVGELSKIKDKFSTPRKTKIIDAVLNYNIEETIQKESVVINITNQGYIKRGPLSSLKAQKRGGKEKTGISAPEQDFVVQMFSANTHTPVLFFSTQGLVYKVKAHKLPEGTASSKGKYIFNILPLKNHHSISSIMPLPEEESEWKNMMVIFATSKGNVRKNTLEDFININNSGKIAMKLDQDDKIIVV